MANSQTEVIQKDLHPQAENLAYEFVNDFAVSLLLQAKTIAYQRKADVVMSSHIIEAREILQSEYRKNWFREILIVLGSAFLGAFIQGFTTELSTGNSVLIAVYTAMGFSGMLMVFWGLRK